MRFAELFASGKKVFSLEFFPPKEEAALPATLELIKTLSKIHPDFMTVTYGAGGGTRERTRQMVSYIHQQLSIAAVAHLTCVGHSRQEIKEIVAALSQEGIKNILALRGDLPLGEATYSPAVDGFKNALELVSFLKSQGDFNIAVAGYPEVHRDALSPEADITYLAQKVAAGAELVLTQLFFEASIYFNFVERAKKAGINVPIVPGIMPISSIGQLERFTQMCGASIPPQLGKELAALQDDKEGVCSFGTSYALSLCEQLLEGGAPGIHLYTINRGKQVMSILSSLQERYADGSSAVLSR